MAQVLDSTAAPALLTNSSTIKDLRNCRDVDPFETTIRGLASYTIPKIDVLVSGTVRSQPGLALVANWPVPNSVIQSIIGRLPPGGLATGNTTVDILDNDHRLYVDDRRTQVDMRFAKILRFGARRLDIGVDLNNLLNTNYSTTFENTYQYTAGNTGLGGTWNNPTAIIRAAVRPLEPDRGLLIRSRGPALNLALTRLKRGPRVRDRRRDSARCRVRGRTSHRREPG